MKGKILIAVLCSMLSEVALAKTHTGIVFAPNKHSVEVKLSWWKTAIIEVDANTIIDLGETTLPTNLAKDTTASLLSMHFGDRVLIDYRREHGTLVATRIVRYDTEDCVTPRILQQ